jgi:hypothetical protein
MAKGLFVTVLAISLATVRGGAYTLIENYDASNFFDKFAFNAVSDQSIQLSCIELTKMQIGP